MSERTSTVRESYYLRKLGEPPKERLHLTVRITTDMGDSIYAPITTTLHNLKILSGEEG